MNTSTRTPTLLLSLLATTTALADSTVQLAVQGALTPSACVVLLSKNGIIDLGRIPAKSLNKDEFTVLPSQILELNVTCGSPTLYALVGMDNRADSSLAPGFFYGLGKNIHAPVERLGSVAFSYRNPVGDGQAVQPLASSNNGASWFPEPNAYPRNYMAFAQPGAIVPRPLTRLDTLVRIDTSINAAMYLTLDQEVPLDGSITLDLRYL